ncbi:migration and invasion enhancer 1 [Cylas formicarius]|uniref:migration and invasion enhancer 1 n=1 Tax=Cylas formicarius TaxID=197179 RepID=UPI002958BE2F|nr:migration and invasion enhancer 1 [Cylas formicarius]
MDDTVVEVEYCNKCGYYAKYEELEKHIKSKHPEVTICGREGRRASFEVKVNGALVHSKLQTLAYPDFDDLAQIVNDASHGKPVRSPCKQQPITSCSLS